MKEKVLFLEKGTRRFLIRTRSVNFLNDNVNYYTLGSLVYKELLEEWYWLMPNKLIIRDFVTEETIEIILKRLKELNKNK